MPLIRAREKDLKYYSTASAFTNNEYFFFLGNQEKITLKFSLITLNPLMVNINFST